MRKYYYIFLLLLWLLVIDLVVLNPLNLLAPSKSVNKSTLVATKPPPQDEFKEENQKKEKEKASKKDLRITHVL